jgi:S-layer homology domain
MSAANFLAGKGIIKQYASSSEYRLTDTITRKEVAKIVTKLAGVEPEEKCEGKFNDVAKDWGCKYIERMLKVGYIAASTTYRPDDNITKSEAVKMIFKARAIEKKYNTGNWQADYAKTASDLGLVDSYMDYTTDAKRGWIFRLAARDFEEYKKQEILISDEVL